MLGEAGEAPVLMRGKGTLLVRSWGTPDQLVNHPSRCWIPLGWFSQGWFSQDLPSQGLLHLCLCPLRRSGRRTRGRPGGGVPSARGRPEWSWTLNLALGLTGGLVPVPTLIAAKSTQVGLTGNTVQGQSHRTTPSSTPLMAPLPPLLAWSKLNR